MLGRNGHFIYKGNPYLTKEAIFYDALLNNDTSPDIGLYFHDEVYAAIDWTIEPDQSLDELYKIRAQQIRDEYDYVILMFSGGSDSYQVLRSFTDNNIFIDEVRTHQPLTMANNIKPIYNKLHPLGLLFEYELAAAPRLKELTLKSPNTKINVIDMSDTISQFDNDNLNNEYSEAIITANMFHVARLIDQYIKVEKHIDTLKARKVAVVFGAEKPFLTVEGGYLKFYFEDQSRSSTGHIKPDIEKNHDEVLFYWDKNLPLIPIKQSHIIKKTLQKHEKLKTLAEDYKVYLRESNLVKFLLYPSTFNPSIYQKVKMAGGGDMAIIQKFMGQKAISAAVEYKKHFENKYKFLEKTLRGYKVSKKIILSRAYDLGRL
jgi:hypothetical protein